MEAKYEEELTKYRLKYKELKQQNKDVRAILYGQVGVGDGISWRRRSALDRLACCCLVSDGLALSDGEQRLSC